MKTLKRMLLIHWYTFTQELIEFDKINFLTGNNSTGKSTLVDAMQVVLLGDTSGRFFNKAASEKSDRSMKGYLYGEWGDDGEAGFTYIRKGPFTTYLVMEFEDTEKKTRFMTGFVCDCYEDMNYRYRWFVTDGAGLPDDLFVDTKTHVPYPLQDLKKRLALYCGKNRFDVIETNRRYQEVILAKFGQLKRKYLTTLRKAVPFTPIADIEKFITESICDVKNNIEIDQMQNDIRQYKSLELEAQRAREKIEALQQIENVTAEYEGNKEKYTQQSYVVIRARLEEIRNEIQAAQEALSEKEEQIASLEECILGAKETIGHLQAHLTELETEYYGSDMVQKLKQLEKQIADTQKEIEGLEKGLDNAQKALNSYAGTWLRTLEETSRDVNAVSVPDEKILQILQSACRTSKETLKSVDLERFSGMLLDIRASMAEHAGDLRVRERQLKDNLETLEEQIRNLEKGIKPYPRTVRMLKQRLEDGLFAAYHRGVEIPVFADLLEIRDASWRDAVEGYLDRQKFNLLVPEEYYKDASRIYDQIRREEQIYDTGIVDLGKLRDEYDGKICEGSLAEEVETEHKDARLYADYLLGRVIKCEDAASLNRYKTAITKNVMLYRNYVSRRLNPKRYADPFIGRRSMEILLQNTKQQKEETEQQLTGIRDSLAKFSRASRLAVMDSYEVQEHKRAILEADRLPDTKQQLAALKEEYAGIDLTYISTLEKKLEEQRGKIAGQQEEILRFQKEQARSEEQKRMIEQEKLPVMRSEAQAVSEQITASFKTEWIEAVGQPRFLKEQAQETRTAMSLRESFERARSLTKNAMERNLSNRRGLRAAYNRDYIMPFDIEREDNDEYSRELHTLADIRLPDYIEKIVDSKEKAYNQFRDDFIAKLKSNIESVREQINELNDSLKHSTFGTDRYRFVITPRAEYRNYYDMITDPMLMDTGGWNIASANFNAKYQKEIDSLFKNLILTETDVSAERRAEYERNIRRFTDYKTYLVFDLIVTNEQGEEQRLSRTLLKKSGGETQIPFYISLLASFSQVCRIRSKGKDNTLRLIILDEAFSKMDGERIRESIPLLRRFGLQAVFSAPPGKIADIAPLADRNIVVYRKGKASFTRHFDAAHILDEGNDGGVL